MKPQEYFDRGQTLLFDGAMGTLYAAQREGACEQAALTDPDTILDIHRQYLHAGCRALKTDTFALTAAMDTPQAEQAAQAARSACRLALQAAAPFDAMVFGDIGPVPAGLESPACRLAQVFLEEGLSCFLVETLSNDRGVAGFARWLKQRCPEGFLLVSFAVGPDGMTREGLSGRELLERTAALPQVDAVGLNCVSGPGHLRQLVQSLPALSKPLSVMPNAGYPTVQGRRAVFQGTPEYFAHQCAQIAAAGAAILGGCCGTTPAHIAALARSLSRPVLPARLPAPAPREPQQQPSAPEGNSLQALLEQGKRVIAVELDPPTDDRIDGFLQGVRTLKQAGADAVTIADCPIGRPRADSSLLACKIKRELGVEPLPHMTCRDRNLNATKALLLGLSMEGIHNILLVTGDPIPSADREQVKSVFNFNSRKLARFVSELNRDTLSVPFQIFGALNLNAPNFHIQLKLAREKEDCGVQGFLTQPILSQTALDNLKLARQSLKGRLLAGIFPVVSYRNACFLNNEIAGIHVCDEIIELYRDKDREACEELAVDISRRVAAAAAPYCHGYYLMTPFSRVALMSRIIRAITEAEKQRNTQNQTELSLNFS